MPAAAAAPALCATAAARADFIAELMKGAETVPAIEKRLPAAAGLPEFADARGRYCDRPREAGWLRAAHI